MYIITLHNQIHTVKTVFEIILIIIIIIITFLHASRNVGKSSRKHLIDVYRERRRHFTAIINVYPMKEKRSLSNIVRKGATKLNSLRLCVGLSILCSVYLNIFSIKIDRMQCCMLIVYLT